MTVGKWATRASSRDLLVGDILWGDEATHPQHITPRWGTDAKQHLYATIWETGANAVAITAADDAGGQKVTILQKRAERFVAKSLFVCNIDGSVPVIARSVTDATAHTEIIRDASGHGRLDATWLLHASMKNLSWIRDRQGQCYKLDGASFAHAKQTLGETLTWNWLGYGEVRFTPTDNISTIRMGKRRHFRRFCLALVLNFPSLGCIPSLVRSLLPFSTKVPTNHHWTLNSSGTEISHWDAGLYGVSFMLQLWWIVTWWRLETAAFQFALRHILLSHASYNHGMASSYVYPVAGP